MEILRLDLGSLALAGSRVPVNGFAITHGDGVIVVDTGVGGPLDGQRQYAATNRSVVDALADHGLSPADARLVINTHLHMDHCGWNSAFAHAPFFVQRSELERARKESPELRECFDFRGVAFELLDGDAPVADQVRVVATPGHTVGHQSVLVDLDHGLEIILGDAAYTHPIWLNPDADDLPPGQAEDVAAWRRSIDSLNAAMPRRLHFSHDSALVPGAHP